MPQNATNDSVEASCVQHVSNHVCERVCPHVGNLYVIVFVSVCVNMWAIRKIPAVAQRKCNQSVELVSFLNQVAKVHVLLPETPLE